MIDKLKEKLITHTDHREARRRRSPWLWSITLPTVYGTREGSKCEACRGRKAARHTAAEYRTPREEFFLTSEEVGSGKFTSYLFPSPPTLSSAKLETEPRECEVCGGSGVYSRAAVDVYFERHPERVCICQANMDHPGTHHGYDASINFACPLFVTYVRTEEEQLREEVTERRTKEWRERGLYAPFDGVQMMIDLEVASTMLQRSTDRLVDVLQRDEELDRLAMSIHTDPELFKLNLYPCRYDPEKLTHIVDGLAARHVTVMKREHGFLAFGKAHRERQERELVESLRMPVANWKDDLMRFHEWLIRGRF